MYQEIPQRVQEVYCVVLVVLLGFVLGLPLRLVSFCWRLRRSPSFPHVVLTLCPSHSRSFVGKHLLADIFIPQPEVLFTARLRLYFYRPVSCRDVKGNARRRRRCWSVVLELRLEVHGKHEPLYRTPQPVNEPQDFWNRTRPKNRCLPTMHSSKHQLSSTVVEV